MLRRTQSDFRVTPLVLVASIALGLVGTTAAQQSKFQSRVNTVSIHATVQDRSGRLVPGLERNDFEVLDNGKVVDITVFSNEKEPFVAVLALDMSHSMARSYGRVVEAAKSFVRAMNDDDRVRVASFGREVSISPLLTSDKNRLLEVLDSELWPGGATPLWRASSLAMQSLVRETGRRVVFLVTDGNDSGGDYNCAPLVSDPRGAIGRCPAAGDIRNRAEAEGFMFYVVGLEGSGLDATIKNIAEHTGGGYFELQDEDNLAKTFERVAEELHHQYRLGFEPTALDGKVHQLEVRTRRKDLAVRARRSYLAISGR